MRMEGDAGFGATEAALATPKQLVECVASALGVEEATVIVHDRNLAVAGLRTMGGRGRAAARMTARDAANLLIAVAGAEQVRDSARAVQDFAALPLRAGSPLPGLRAGHDFGEALTLLIQAV